MLIDLGRNDVGRVGQDRQRDGNASRWVSSVIRT